MRTDETLPIPAERLPTTVKTLKFAQYYLETGSPLEAARRAGFKASSEAALSLLGNRLLEREDVSLYVVQHLKALISSEEAGSILSDIARGDISVFMKFKPEGGWDWDFSTPQAQANMHLIRAIKATKHGYEIQFYDKLQALALIAKYTGLDDPKSASRRAVERLLVQLSPEQRAQVREELLREPSADLIEGERGTLVDSDEDLSFLRAGAFVAEDLVGDGEEQDGE